MDNYAKENISTKQPPSGEETRLSGADGDQKRAQRHQTATGKRTQAINGSSLLDFRLPKSARLRKPSEFRRVYAEGKRFDGRLMTIFIAPSDDGEVQRLGITASKKGVGNAVQRNRAKRLLREAFRLSRAELGRLETKFDWVLNARRNLLRVKLDKPLAEFRQIIEKVRKFESENKIGETSVGQAK